MVGINQSAIGGLLELYSPRHSIDNARSQYPLAYLGIFNIY